MLRKRPGFTAVAALMLALGIGATAAVYSQQVERIEATPAVQWLDWQKQAKSFDALAAYVWTFNFLIDSGGSESLEGMVVTPDYFRVVGIQPMLGRAFSAS